MKENDTALLARVEEIAEPIVRESGIELVLVELGRAGGTIAVKITIDRPNGVTIEDCALFSRRLGAALEVDDPFPGAYELEVSSPGLDRRLVKESDYTRFAGSEAKVSLKSPLDGRRNFDGVLRGIEDGEVLLQLENGQIARLPFKDVDKARLVPQF